VARVVIGVQLVIAGFQLPAKYQQIRWKEMALCLLPIMTIMWLCTTLCLLAAVPKITLLAALVIGSCVTCTDPILSQAIAKGPFADKFVARDLREIISSEAGANDGFGFPFLMLATYLIRHADIPGAGVHAEAEGATAALHERAFQLMARAGDVGRLGGGVGVALQNWVVETWLYIVVMSVAIGALVGFASQYALKFALRRYVSVVIIIINTVPLAPLIWPVQVATDPWCYRKWVDSESYLLYPTAIGVSTPPLL
jgi:NhaP-type Na+/H+ or K+/H+ antiporter